MENRKKGFTLTELLVTIAIIGLVGSLGGYFVINAINNAKDQSDKIAINNMKKGANSYIKEYDDEVVWKTNINNSKEEISCISINTLISKGYLKNSVLENENIPKSIIITRDENKNIISEDEVSEDCDSYSKKVDIPSSKEICNTITYDGYEHDLIKATNGLYTATYADSNYNNAFPTNAGDYKVKLTLDNNRVWKDNTTTDKEITCTIKKAIPQLELLDEEDNYTTGTSDEELGIVTIKVKSPETSGTIEVKSSNKNHATASIVGDKFISTEEDEVEIKLNILATRDTLTYITITLTPDESETNYKTSTISYTIGKVTNKKTEVPVCNNLQYNKEDQSLITENEAYTLNNNTKSEVGIYTVTAKLNYGYTWEDNTTAPVALECEIKKATPTITFEDDTCNPKNITLEYGSNYTNLCNPTSPPGYVFEGWSQVPTDEEDPTVIEPDNTPIEDPKDHELYPIYTPITYTINYNCNGGSGSTASSTHTYDVAKNLTSNTCTRLGYSFDGWNTNSQGTGTNYSNNQSVINLTTTNNETITLYAKWKQSISVTVLNQNYIVCPEDQNKPARAKCVNGQYNSMFVNYVIISGTTVRINIRLHMNNTELTWAGTNNTRMLCLADSSNTCRINLYSFTINNGWTTPGGNPVNQDFYFDVKDLPAGNYRIIVDGGSTKFRFKTTSYVLDTIQVIK